MGLFGKEKAFYQGQVKKYSALFGNLFSDLYIVRKTDTKTEYVHVPIKYGPGNLRNKANTDFGLVRTGIHLPAMSFELRGIEKDPGRLINQNLGYRRGSPEVGTLNELTTRVPVPHDINYRLTIATKTIEEMLMIIEQVVDVFNPQVTIRLLDNNPIGIERDITVKMTSDGYEIDDNYERSQEENRRLEVFIDFTVKGYLYHNSVEKPVTLEMVLGSDAFQFNSAASSTEVKDYIHSATPNNIGDKMAEVTKGI
jgi:hypothetical protein